MNKIINAALSTKFKGVNVETLMEVINATGNAIVATELILGAYEAPVIPALPVKGYIYKEDKNTLFVSYDKFKDEITYSYNRQNVREGWVKNDVENPQVDALLYENYYVGEAAKKAGLAEDDFKAQYTKISFDLGLETRLRTRECSLNNWMSNEN